MSGRGEAIDGELILISWGEDKMSFRGYEAPSSQVEIADNVLNEVFSITKQLEIKTFLMFGTCLGFVRDGGYIQGDFDLDIGVICKWEERDVLTNAFEINGIILVRSKSKKKHVHYRKNNIGIDIWFRKEESYPNFDSIDYKGRKYPIPYPIEEYLSACYSNWKIKEKQTTRYFG